MVIPRRTIKVPLKITKAIDRYIEKSKGFYRSRPEVVTAAIEKFVRPRKKRKSRKGA